MTDFATPTADLLDNSRNNDVFEDESTEVPGNDKLEQTEEPVSSDQSSPKPDITVDHVGVGDNFQTPEGSLSVSSPKPSSPYSTRLPDVSTFHGNLNPKHSEAKDIVLFLVGTLLGVAIATIVAFKYGRRRRRRRRGKESNTAGMYDSDSLSDDRSCDEVAFDDEYDDVENGKNPPLKIIRGTNPKNRLNQPDDWLGGVGFGSEDTDENSINFEEDEKRISKHNIAKVNSDHDLSFNVILNQKQHDHSSSSLVYDVDQDDKGMEMKPRGQRNLSEKSLNVNQGQNNSTSSLPDIQDEYLSPRWKSKEVVKSDDFIDTKFESLQKRYEELNEKYYKLNDQLVHKQRDLEKVTNEMTKKMTRRKHRDHSNQHKEITATIIHLEEEKSIVKKQLKSIQKKIKSLREERRRNLFLDLNE